jgi:hypothetical protein
MDCEAGYEANENEETELKDFARVFQVANSYGGIRKGIHE